MNNLSNHFKWGVSAFAVIAALAISGPAAIAQDTGIEADDESLFFLEEEAAPEAAASDTIVVEAADEAEEESVTVEADDAEESAAMADKPTGPRLDEVVVTAEKREEALQDVPVSIVAFPKEQLEFRGIDELKDFAANIPNVFVNNFSGAADTIRLFIRGLGQNSVEPTQDPSVALYIDGIYVGSAFGTGFELVDLERVEVLRGPQGTLYGRNATGGAINMITARPDEGVWDFRQSFTYGNFNAFKSRTTINTPLGEDGGIKLSALVSQRDGLVENLGQGPDFGEEDRLGFRIDATYNIADALRIDFAADASFIKDSAPYEQGLSGDAASGSTRKPLFDPIGLSVLGINVPVVQPYGNYTFADPVRSKRNSKGTAARPYRTGDNEVYGVSLTMTWDVSDDHRIKSISGFRKVDRDNFGDFAPYTSGSLEVALPLPVLNQLGIPVPGGNNPIADQADLTAIDQFSQELQLLSDTTLFGQTFISTAGLYFYSDKIHQDASNSTTLEGPRAQDETEAKNLAGAIFAQGTWTLPVADDRLHLTLGLRGSWDKREAERINENSYAFAEKGGFTAQNCQTFSLLPHFIDNAQPCIPNGTVEPTFYDETFYNVNPGLTLEYDLNPDTNLYGKIVTGYKTGGTSTRSANPDNFGEGFDQEELISYELGLKGAFMDQRLQLNTALFYTVIDGFQTSIQTGATPGDRDFIGIDGSTILGFEADLVFAITEWMIFRGSYGTLQTELGQDQVTTRDSSGQALTVDLNSRFAYAPKHSMSLAVDAFLPINDWLIFTGYLAYNFQSRMHGSVNKADDGILGSRGLVDVNFGLISSRLPGQDGILKLNIYGKNIFDNEYLITNTSAFAFAGVDYAGAFGEPRTFGLTLTYDY